ncbi:MAG: hypothetical protein DI565_15930 [Ancylobacter novellus]|uniref:Multi-ubiquitin domain-containing protein n=1 Tax=Ancylobacter novellus TaxID=921 RepID=A0A2W5LYK2_ANCNO|nr:MAG: hypothetical protein DI565_15930 [Ancylobacter novellus]
MSALPNVKPYDPGDKAPKPEKTVTIVINGQQKTVGKQEELTFEEVVTLSGEVPSPGSVGVQYSIQYTRGHGSKPAGTLVEGQSVKVKDGMEFDVTPTNRS